MAVAVCAIFNYMAGVRPQMVTVADDHGKTKIALAKQNFGSGEV